LTISAALPDGVNTLLTLSANINIISGAVICGAVVYYIYRSIQSGVQLVYLIPRMVKGVCGGYFCLVYAIGSTTPLPLTWITENSNWLLRPVLMALLLAVAAQMIMDARALDATEAAAEAIKAKALLNGRNRSDARTLQRAAKTLSKGGPGDE